MTQSVFPTATDGSSGFSSTAYTDVNEDPYDDGDYNVSNDNQNGYITYSLGDPTDPSDHTGHVLKARIRQENQNKQRTYQLELLQGSTQIAIGTATNCNKTAFVECTLMLSESEAANITDYTDLKAKITTGGDVGTPPAQRAEVWISWVSFDCPDAGGGTYNESVSLGRDQAVTESGGLIIEAAASI